MAKLSLEKDKIKILLLEGIDQSSADEFKDFGYYNLERISSALSEKELLEKLSDTFILGIRSRTFLSKEIIAKAPKLFAVGCFCIGTDQVDLKAAAMRGIPVFNAPHSNTRSVAELVIGLTILLMRGVFKKNAAAHRGTWLKSAEGAHEVRRKTLGIVGYGHIGSQVSVLAESIGMEVIYFDIASKLPLGNAKAVASLEKLLNASDVVTLHVPDNQETKNLMNEKCLSQMKKGALLINLSRGSVVDLDALNHFLDQKYIKGAALDVFPQEPARSGGGFACPLRGKENVVLTPHIGGSTEEVQQNIGIEVSRKLIQYSDSGSTEGAVNFPELSLPCYVDTHRILHIHKNIPGMLQKINKAVADEKINVLSQYLLTNRDIGYVVLDIEKSVSKSLCHSLQEIEGTLRARVLY